MTDKTIVPLSEKVDTLHFGKHVDYQDTEMLDFVPWSDVVGAVEGFSNEIQIDITLLKKGEMALDTFEGNIKIHFINWFGVKE